jgi:peroxiredoxin
MYSGTAGLIQAYSALKDKGFEIIGISVDDDLQKLERFVKEVGVTWPQYFDSKGFQNDIASRFEIQVVPTMWLVGKGRDRHQHQCTRGSLRSHRNGSEKVRVF